MRAGGRVATFHFAAFFRSKTLICFDGWFSWQPAAKTSRWAATNILFENIQVRGLFPQEDSFATLKESLMINTSIEDIPDEKISARRKAIFMPVLAFLGAQLNNAGVWCAIIAKSQLNTNNFGGFINVFSSNPFTGIAIAILAFLLLWASFLMLSLYHERGRRQVVAGFLGVISWIIGSVGSYSVMESLNFVPRDQILIFAMGIGTAIGITVCLLVGHKLERLPDIIGLVLGLLIGIGLCIINPKLSMTFVFYPIWLSGLVFQELFSHRAGWMATLVGGLLGVVLMVLAMLIVH
jgi:hypothetical protein